MKKLLLGIVMAALFVTDADGSVFQTKSSKSGVDDKLKEGMGNYYKGMVSFVHAMVLGWKDTFSYAAKDPDFASSKTYLNDASKKLKVIAEFTQSMLNMDRMNDIDKKKSSASTAVTAFQAAINSLKQSDYWKHCGAQLRFSIIATNNALLSLVYPETEFDIGGMKYSSKQGLIDNNGCEVKNDITTKGFSTNQAKYEKSKATDLANGFIQLTNSI